MALFKEKKLQVKTYGNPVLRRKSEPVKAITPEIRQLIKKMISCMYEEEGIGLAAPQIGMNLRLFVIDTHVNENELYMTPGEAELSPKMPLAIINPEIVATSGPDTPFVEGCLSVPGVHATVMRPEIIRLRGMTEDGQTFELECGGLLSRCAQHEIDHLNGVLFTDIANSDEVAMEKMKLEKLEKSNKGKAKKL